MLKKKHITKNMETKKHQRNQKKRIIHCNNNETQLTKKNAIQSTLENDTSHIYFRYIEFARFNFELIPPCTISSDCFCVKNNKFYQK